MDPEICRGRLKCVCCLRNYHRVMPVVERGTTVRKANLFGMADSHFIPLTNNNTSSYFNNNNQPSSNNRESNLFFNTQFFVYLNMSMSRGFEDGDNNKGLMIML